MERRELTLPGLRFSVSSQLHYPLGSCATEGVRALPHCCGCQGPLSLTLKWC